MDPTKVDKKLVLLALAVLGPKVKTWTGYELTTDDVYTLVAAGVAISHALDVWQAKRAAKVSPATVAEHPVAPATAEPAPPPKAP